MLKQWLLKQLLLARPMDTAQQWRLAVDQVEFVDLQSDAQHGGFAVEASSPQTSANQIQASLLDAVNAVVPYFPEYSIVILKLEALMEYCHTEYPVETDQLLCFWLQRGARFALPFRCWLLEWLLGQEGIVALMKENHESVDTQSARRRQWQCALYAAALQEEHAALKRQLVQALHELGPLEDEALATTILKCGPSTQTTESKDATISTMDNLLEFYWEHGCELAPFTLLCAVKLHAMVTECRDTTNRSRSGFLRLTDDVLVRLRWSKVLKPAFFDGLLRCCFELKVFESHVTIDTFAVHPALQQHVKDMGESKRIAMLDRLAGLKEQFEAAFNADAVHFHAGDTTGKIIRSNSSDFVKDLRFLHLGSIQQRLVLLDLERDLEDAPVSLFPHILLSASTLVRALMTCRQGEEATNDLLLMALASMFTLLELRRDQESCFFVAAALFDAQVARHRIWLHAPNVFAEIVEMLTQVHVMEVNRPKRWIVTIMLQYLLFECDADVLQQNWITLEKILPKRQAQLSRVRLSST